MSSALHKILTSENLDHLFELAQSIDDLSSDEIDIISPLLQAWTVDKQAVANLLMVPQLIPSKQRAAYLIKALQENNIEYYKLAAAVGLQDLDKDDFTEAQTIEFSTALIDLVKISRSPVSQRASVSLKNYSAKHDIPRLLGCFSLEDEDLLHNMLVLIISLVGAEEFYNTKQSIFAEVHLSESANLLLDSAFSELADCFEHGVFNKFSFLMSSLSTPKLAYIPNLKDWT